MNKELRGCIRGFIGYLMLVLMIVLLVMVSDVSIASAEVHTTGVNSASEHISILSYTTTSSGQYDYSVPPFHLWTCFDHSMNYSKHNPEWGMVCISSNRRFQGMNHVVNYQINYSDNTLMIHDGLLENDYTVSGWEYDSCTFDYYHFYIDSERPTRYYNRRGRLNIKPNAKEVYRDWILTR